MQQDTFLDAHSNTTIIYCYAKLAVVPEANDGGLVSVTLLRFETSTPDRSSERNAGFKSNNSDV